MEFQAPAPEPREVSAIRPLRSPQPEIALRPDADPMTPTLPRPCQRHAARLMPPNELYPSTDRQSIGSYRLGKFWKFYSLAIAQAADQDNSNRTTDPLGEITLGLAET